MLLISCQNESHPAFSPGPSPSPHISPAAAVLQSNEVPTGLTACVGSNQPVDVYASVMNGFDTAIGLRWSGYWDELVAEGAESGSVSVYASDPASCSAELGAGNASAIASVVIRFADDGAADRAWQAGVFGFIPPAPAQLQAGMTRGAATGLGLSSFTYERPSARLASWRRNSYAALMIATNLDVNAYKAATALINARLN
jgi:hypothetical protein